MHLGHHDGIAEEDDDMVGLSELAAAAPPPVEFDTSAQTVLSQRTFKGNGHICT